MNQKTLVIVPTYNERENLPKLVERIMRQPALVDLLIVDGNSPDGTGQLGDEIAANNPRVHVFHEKEKAGLGRAYCAAFQSKERSRWIRSRSTRPIRPRT